jgi:ribosomal-protein-alanine N-acetyltransferase
MVTIERLGGAGELDDILAIDRESFSSPWSRAMYEDDLRNPQSQIWVARVPGGAVAGYCAVWLVLDEVHINNVAVRRESRQQGIGRALVVHALRAGAERGARAATLEVRRANEPARRLYEGLGFRESGVRRGYYDGPVDDALILWAEIQFVGCSPAP